MSSKFLVMYLVRSKEGVDFGKAVCGWPSGCRTLHRTCEVCESPPRGTRRAGWKDGSQSACGKRESRIGKPAPLKTVRVRHPKIITDQRLCHPPST